jgi:DNA-binding transcriptional MerR regulator
MIHVSVTSSRGRARHNGRAVSARQSDAQPTPAGEEQVRYTIDQLAQVTGMTVRNIRAHQSRGLLPPPDVRGRTGYYGPEHAARIRLIVDMQADGFNLGAIARLLESTAPGTATSTLTFTHALREPWAEEQTEIMDAAELATRAGAGRPDPDLLSRSEELGLITPLGDGRYEVLSPALIRAGEALVSLGIPIEAGLEVQQQLKRHAEGIARAFVRMFVDTVWEPFEAAGKPEADWPRVQEALERLRPLAGEAVTATFRMAMGRAVDEEAARMMAGGLTAKPSRRGKPERRVRRRR